MRTPRFHVSAWKAGTAPLSGEPIGQFFQSFPVHFPVAKGEAMKTGIQISSLKPLLTSASQVHQAFEKISAMGCRYVQLQWIDPSVPMEDIAQALQDTGLVSVSVQEIYDTFLQNPDYYLRLNQLTGGTWLCISRVPARLRLRQGLAEFAETFRRLGDTVQALGQKLCFHPVASDLTSVDGLIPADYLLEKMPELTLCADLYHVNRSGYNVPEWLRERKGRICMVHFKDGLGSRLVPAGQGDIDWTGAVQASADAGAHYAFVEQETWDRDPFDCLQEALSWLNCQVR